MAASRFIVATDGSEAAQAACRMAAEMAQALRPRTVTVVSVVRMGITSSSLGGGGIIPPDHEHIGKHEELLEKAADEVRGVVTDDSVQVETKLLQSSSPAEAILAEARGKQGETHLFIGNRGRGGFAGLILGSVAQAVLHHADCPVTVVR